ncbi:Hexokinase, partial [Ostertagia ostertagi]
MGMARISCTLSVRFPRNTSPKSLRDDWGTYSNTKQIIEELGIEDYSFSDLLVFREVCLVVSRRSANLVAAAIACVLNRIRRPKMVVAIDGSTYKYHPFFEHWIAEKVKELLDPTLK